MNALEMAEELEKGPLVPRDDAAKMIRQQQAEIEALKDKLMLARQSLEIVEGWVNK
jgi:hypothetical protein|tara:strand:+ start:7160 stop:7327 length:168 start_codon:yes stop_codon:yes gene_type:complete